MRNSFLYMILFFSYFFPVCLYELISYEVLRGQELLQHVLLLLGLEPDVVQDLEEHRVRDQDLVLHVAQGGAHVVLGVQLHAAVGLLVPAKGWVREEMC